MLRQVADIRRKTKSALGLLRPPTLQAYLGYGALTGTARVLGRALESTSERPPTVEDSSLTNLRRTIAEFRREKLPELEVSLSVGGKSKRVRSNCSGFFEAEVEGCSLLPGINPVEYELNGNNGQATLVCGQLIVPASEVRVGVISDIDDTILQTHVQSRSRMILISILSNALTRMGYEGTTHWYRGIQAATSAPFFYVSRSAWGLYSVLQDFIAHQGLPEGSLLLREVGLLPDREARRGHKYRRIRQILATYPELAFVCIGDTGQRDAEIYRDLSLEQPGKIRAIYLRDVGDPLQRARAEELLLQSSVPGLIFSETIAAIRHAERLGLWRPPAA